MDSQLPKKVTCNCPSGHKVRGDVTFVGETVACPRCQKKFVFGVKEPEQIDVTESAVMRILGEPPTYSPAASGSPEVPATHPCDRCGVAIDETATVCKHCNSYVGMLPGFMKSMMKEGSFSQN